MQDADVPLPEQARARRGVPRAVDFGAFEGMLGRTQPVPRRAHDPPPAPSLHPPEVLRWVKTIGIWVS